MPHIMNAQWTHSEGNIAIPYRCKVVFLKASSSHDNAEPFTLQRPVHQHHKHSSCTNNLLQCCVEYVIGSEI